MRIEPPNDAFIQLIRQLSALATAYGDYEEMQEEVLALLGAYTQANTLWLDSKGKVWAQALQPNTHMILPMQADGVFLEPRLFSRLLQMGEGASQLDLPSPCQFLSLSSEDILLLYREDQPFRDDEKAFGEICLPVLILLQRLRKEKGLAEQQRQAQLVKAAMNTLSFTELEVVVRIFEALGKEDGTRKISSGTTSEGILVAGKIADGLGITRSVVVSALRKLESARIIETRSLGVKGTYIRVINPLWMREIEKL